MVGEREAATELLLALGVIPFEFVTAVLQQIALKMTTMTTFEPSKDHPSIQIYSESNPQGPSRRQRSQQFVEW